MNLNFPNEFRHAMEFDGYQIIEPDGKTFKSFSLRHWRLQSFLARKGDTIYVALVEAKRIGHGAFTELIKEIDGRGLRVAVIAPLFLMEETLKRRGFEFGCELVCGYIEDVWRKPVDVVNGSPSALGRTSPRRR